MTDELGDCELIIHGNNHRTVLGNGGGRMKGELVYLPGAEAPTTQCWLPAVRQHHRRNDNTDSNS